MPSFLKIVIRIYFFILGLMVPLPSYKLFHDLILAVFYIFKHVVKKENCQKQILVPLLLTSLRKCPRSRLRAEDEYFRNLLSRQKTNQRQKNHSLKIIFLPRNQNFREFFFLYQHQTTHACVRCD